MTATTAEKVTEVEKSKVKKNEVDLEAILPPPGEVVIGGIDCYVSRLKFREFAALMGILTTAFGSSFEAEKFNPASMSEMSGELVGSLLAAIPYQTDQFLHVVRMITKAKDSDKQSELNQHLVNPDIEDLLPIIDAVVENEKETIWDLMGKARAYLSRWQMTVQAAKRRQ